MRLALQRGVRLRKTGGQRRRPLGELAFAAGDLTRPLGSEDGFVPTNTSGASVCNLEEIDFRGFDPSTLTDFSYCLSSCTKLTTIYADASWALPTSGITDGQCFYNSKALVGGNGTAWSSSNVSYTYMRIDKAGQPGYLTAA